MLKKYSESSGFSLIELLVVATIIIVLTTIGLVSFQSAGRNSRDAKRKADLETVRQGLVLYRADLGSYPTGSVYGTMTTRLIDLDYLTSPAPTDPKGTAPNVYSYSSAGSDFCVCASMENSANAGGASGCSAPTNGYCVSNP